MNEAQVTHFHLQRLPVKRKSATPPAIWPWKKKGEKKKKSGTVVIRAEGEGVLSLCGLAESHVTQAL